MVDQGSSENKPQTVSGQAIPPQPEKTNQEKLAELKTIVGELKKSPEPTQKYLAHHMRLIESFLENPHPTVFIALTTLTHPNQYRPGEMTFETMQYERMRQSMDDIIKQEGGEINQPVKTASIDAVLGYASLINDALREGKTGEGIWEYLNVKESGGFAKTAVLTYPAYSTFPASQFGLPHEVNFVNVLRTEYGGKLFKAAVQTFPRIQTRG